MFLMFYGHKHFIFTPPYYGNSTRVRFWQLTFETFVSPDETPELVTAPVDVIVTYSLLKSLSAVAAVESLRVLEWRLAPDQQPATC